MPGPKLEMKSRFVGCLVGCAVGDALGAPFEGYWEHQLPGRKALLGGFAEVEGYPRGQYTDDTQLTLATPSSRSSGKADLLFPRISRDRSPPSGRTSRSSGPAGPAPSRRTPS